MSVITVTDSTFDAEVLQSKLPTLVEFTTRLKSKKDGTQNASAKMDVILDELASQYEGKVKFVRVEIELDQDLKDSLNPVSSTKYAINHGPTLVLINAGERAKDQDGSTVNDRVGLQTKDSLIALIDKLLPGLLKVDFKTFIEEQINLAAQGIVTKKSIKLDDIGFGKLGFYLALRRAVNGTPSAEDIGLLDALNDSLQALRLLARNETFLDHLKK